MAYQRIIREICQLLSPRPDAGRIEGHDAFILLLRRDHGRKWKFWGLYDAA